MPVKPTVAKRDVAFEGQNVKVTVWTGREPARNFLVTHLAWPKKMSEKDRRSAIEGLKNGFLQTGDATLRGERLATYGGINGRLVSFRRKVGGDGALWIVNRPTELFVLTIAVQSGTVGAARDRFFGSFRLR